jgi:hypothetical protein
VQAPGTVKWVDHIHAKFGRAILGKTGIDRLGNSPESAVQQR